MAYNTKYFAKVLDLDNKTTTVNLKKKNYSGATYQITHYPINPIALTYRAGNKDDDSQIHGSEFDFSFYSLESDNDKYDELFESEMRDWKIEAIRQPNTLYNTPIELQTYENIASGVDWSDYSTNGIQSTVTSFFSAPAPTKRAIYPLYLTSGNTVAVDFAGNYTQSHASVATVNFTISLLDESKNFIIGSSVSIAITEPTISISTTVVLTATTANAHYLSVQGLYNPDGTANSSCTIRYTSLTPHEQSFAPTAFWHGWVQPDYLSRKFLNSAYTIDLTATDGLAELKDIDYPVDLIYASGTTTGINILKNILNETDLELPILSQMNYITNNISLSDSFFTNIYLNTNRFLKKNKDGRKQYMNCFDALQYTLSAFNCRISQVNANWEIIQKNEVSSPLTTFDWSTLVAVKADRTRLINIDDLRAKFDSDELTKVRPVKTYNLTYYNKNVGESTIGNGGFDTDLDGWNNGTSSHAWNTYEWEDGRIHLESLAHNGSSHYLETDSFVLDNLGITSGATLNISFDYEYKSGSYNPGLLFNVIYLMSGSTIISGGVPYNLSEIVGEVGTKATVQKELPFSKSGIYYLRIVTSIPLYIGATQDHEFYFDNVQVVQQYTSSATYDKLFRGQLAGAQFGKQQIEIPLYFSQGTQVNDIGNIKYNSSTGLTTQFSNHDLSVVNKNHQYLFLYEKLKMFRLFKNYLRLTFKNDMDINFNSVLELDSKKYYIIGMRYLIQTCDMQLDLVELLQTDFTLDYDYVQDLTSIDGESSE